MARKLFDELSAVWYVVSAENTSWRPGGYKPLWPNKMIAWLDAKAVRRMVKLDLHHMASGPGG